MSPDERTAEAWLPISQDACQWFVDRALDEMVAIVRGLGDVDANRRPDFDGANSPYAILTHCLGVLEFWGGRMITERTITRDRAAEFEATGTVDALIERTDAARRQYETDTANIESLAPPPNVLPPKDLALPYARSKGAVLLHVMRELFQHLGHMELTRDMLRVSR